MMVVIRDAVSSKARLRFLLIGARNAVDGNTDGNWYNNSTTSTRSEQGAWWQVDLGSKKIINQIIIYNRTDCCAVYTSII
jgi:hypothetical protein